MVQSIIRFVVIAVIITFVFGLLSTVVFNWNIDLNSHIGTFASIISIVAYFIPVSRLMPIITIFIASMVFRVVITIIKTIWDIIPISG